METTWEISCERYFPETEEITKKGTPKRMMIDVRKMILHGSFIVTDCYEIHYLKRNKEWRFYVKEKTMPYKERWVRLPLNKVKTGPTWKREGNYTREQFGEWLRKRVGQQSEQLISQLVTMPPQNLAA